VVSLNKIQRRFLIYIYSDITNIDQLSDKNKKYKKQKRKICKHKGSEIIVSVEKGKCEK
jgi:hypothetical protein